MTECLDQLVSAKERGHVRVDRSFFFFLGGGGIQCLFPYKRNTVFIQLQHEFYIRSYNLKDQDN